MNHLEKAQEALDTVKAAIDAVLHAANQVVDLLLNHVLHEQLVLDIFNG